MIIAGIDEAGYGPLLGPLVVSASAFEVPVAELCHEIDPLPCLWTELKLGVARKQPCKKGRVLIADSKIVHNFTGGDRLLERGVLSFANQLDPTILSEPCTALKLIKLFGCEDHDLPSYRWYGHHDPVLPYMAEAGDLRIAANMVGRSCSKANIKLLAIRTALVPERKFNEMVNRTHNKASALISITLKHLYDLHNMFGARGLVVGIDKQGARDKYTDLLMQSFPEAKLRVLLEGDAGSSYLIQDGAKQTVVHFREKSETKFLSTALASMVCKYLREMCMNSFNNWWAQQVPNLKPTAGYYSDGMRWLADVEPHLARLGVSREELVRIR